MPGEDWAWGDVSDKDALVLLQGLGADFLATDTSGRGLLHVAARKDDATWFKML